MALINRMMERRAISPQTLFRTGLDTLPTSSESGVRVDHDTALNFTAVWACVRLLTSDISTLPIDAVRRTRDGSRLPLDPQPLWLSQPDSSDPSITRIDHFAQVATSLLLDGNAFIICTPSVFEPLRLEVANPRRVKVTKPGSTPRYEVLDANGRPVGNALTPLDVIHVRINAKPGELRGMSPITANSEAIGIGLAAEKFTARFFGSGMQVPGFVEMPGEPTQAQLDAMGNAMQRRHGGWRKAHVFGFLTGGAKFTSTGISPKDADLSALLGHQLEETARIYGIPPFMVGSQEPSGVAYASSVERAQHYIDHCLIHYLRPIEEAYGRLVPGDGRRAMPGSDTFIKFNLNALLRGDPKERGLYYKALWEIGALTPNEILASEDKPPYDGGDVHYYPAANYAPVGETLPSAKPAEPAPIRSDPAFALNIAEAVMPQTISVEAPAVTVNVPAQEPPLINVAPPDMTEVAAALRSRDEDVRELTDRLDQPVHRAVVRDEAGKIVGVIERRGAKVTSNPIDYGSNKLEGVT